MFWAWISGITAAILLLFLAPVRLEVVYCYRDGEDFLGLTISIPGGWGSWEVNFTPRRHKLLAPDIADWGNFFSGDKEATQPLERLAGHTARRKSSGQREGKAG
ncbi:MAG: hypothetical protein H5T99_00630, partial [Moorella sp. (in: Bacteria)]|nr:hypothetical protein [Moorella sp. (in: firmicutes)]